MLIFMIFFAFLVTVMIITVVVANSVLRKRDLDQMKALVRGKGVQAGKSETPLMKDKTSSKREAVARFVLGSSLTERLRSQIEQAGLDWDPARTVYLSLLLALVGFNIFWYMILRGQVISFIGVFVGGGAPFLYLYQKRKSRLMKFEAQFPDALEFVSRAMRSGHAFSVSLEMLHKEYAAPLGDEFRRTFDEQNLGLPLEVALERLGTRIPLLDVHFSVSAVLLQKRTGGNLASLLDNLAYLVIHFTLVGGLGLGDNVSIGQGLTENQLFDESVEDLAYVAGLSTVEAKGEFIEVALQMHFTHLPLVRRYQPALEQRGNQVDMREFLGGYLRVSRCVGDPIAIAGFLQAPVTPPAVAMDQTA